MSNKILTFLIESLFFKAASSMRIFLVLFDLKRIFIDFLLKLLYLVLKIENI